MELYYKNTKVCYELFGEGSVVLYLHGWGGNLQSFMPIANQMKNKNLLIDFPPFGNSEEPKEIFTIYDYANIVDLILKANNIKEFSIVCHSFGARVAICLNCLNKYDITKLVITGGAGIKPKNNIKKFFRKIKYKIKKFFNKNAKIGSKDYQNLSPIMKKTFSNIIQKDLSGELKNIKAQTLLIYGNKDKETPIYMAKKFNKLICNSKLYIYKNRGHFAYLQNINQFVIDVKKFLKE